ncbi:unnamed protein product [Pleuronectes platessa]|uniref:Uncharacterized protein n=1 Tax=Pleuronectes platessa TaxID=8262 RepID=A0A9N7Y866_PLEPL|nr:unnamed protein product [Pleuronectes platessa]
MRDVTGADQEKEEDESPIYNPPLKQGFLGCCDSHVIPPHKTGYCASAVCAATKDCAREAGKSLSEGTESENKKRRGQKDNLSLTKKDWKSSEVVRGKSLLPFILCAPITRALLHMEANSVLSHGRLPPRLRPHPRCPRHRLNLRVWGNTEAARNPDRDVPVSHLKTRAAKSHPHNG